MAKRNLSTIIETNVNNGRECDNCGFSYRKFSSRQEKQDYDAKRKGAPWEANICGSRLRKILEIPEERTCENWIHVSDTFKAESVEKELTTSKLKD